LAFVCCNVVFDVLVANHQSLKFAQLFFLAAKVKKVKTEQIGIPSTLFGKPAGVLGLGSTFGNHN
jgi:hypothetical protein